MESERNHEMDKARMKYLIKKMDEAKYEQRKTKKRVLALGVMLVVIAIFLPSLVESSQQIIDIVTVPAAIALIVAYFDYDINNVNRYNNYLDQLYELGSRYYSLEEIDNEENEIIRRVSETIKY